ncbi:MAG: dihydroorotate dehydrogenase electron transfer subunit [Clostridiales bacterium]|nr:dihydroorotate dehydrogenase electron transfer subunit [Clostridiales bacterium]
MKSDYIILSNKPLASRVYEMKLSGDTTAFKAAGQFINIKLDGKFLRRPISVADYADGCLTIIYKVVGAGTEQMSQLKAGDMLDCLAGLGNGFTVMPCQSPVVIGGGVGVPPLYNLTKKLIKQGQNATVIMGFNKKNEIFYEQEFKALGAKVIVATADGSYGEKGFVTDVMNINYDYIYACGPVPMLKAVNSIAKTPGQFSLEERMGCGFGACMGCSCKTKNGAKRVCCDGPVFERGELLW